MSAHRNNQLNIPGIASNNWNGYDNSGVNFWDELDTNTYLPLSNSSLVDDGITVPSISHPLNGTSPDIGALEYGILPWQAGVDWSPSFYPWMQHFGVEAELTLDNLMIYPNPAKDGFKIQGVWANENPLEICVYDQSGRLWIKETLSDTSDRFIPTQDLNNGSYYVIVTSVGRRFAEKLLIID